MKIDCLQLAKINCFRVYDEIKTFPSRPKLAIIMVGYRNDSSIYVKNKVKTLTQYGCDHILYNFGYSIREDDILKTIDALNSDPNIHGIMVQSPLPGHINMDKIKDRISFKKDVDCFNPYNVGIMFRNDHILEPCTPKGVVRILESVIPIFEGDKVVIAGRSSLVGRPLSELLMQKKNCTVEIIHSFSSEEQVYNSIKNCNIFISSIGEPLYWNKDNFKHDSTTNELKAIIDVGIHNINGKVVGDINPELYNIAKYHTTVPGGVGPMTVAMLLENLTTCYKLQNNISQELHTL